MNLQKTKFGQMKVNLVRCIASIIDKLEPHLIYRVEAHPFGGADRAVVAVSASTSGRYWRQPVLHLVHNNVLPGGLEAEVSGKSYSNLKRKKGQRYVPVREIIAYARS